MSINTSRERQGGGKGRRALVFVLLAASFVVFVVGGFVFAYLSIASVPSPASASAPVFQNPVSVLPAVPLGSFAPSASPRPGEKPSPPPPESAAKRRVSFLLLGIDQRDDERGAPTRTDTMMVVSVDPGSKTAAMISLPRDMWVEIPGYADNRINVANFLGDAYHYPGGGPVLAEKTVEQNFGLKIDYYARIDFRGFEKIVDTLGGVDIDVERAIRDDEYPTEDYEIMSIYIPAGRQHMNGKVALQYARSRHSESDFGRAKRQQRLLIAIRDRAMQLDVIPKLPSLMSALMGMVQTDIPPTEFLRLAALAKDVNSNSVSSLVIDDKLASPYRGEGGADLLMPNKPAIRKAIGALLADPVVKNEAARIEVLNGTNRSGLATRVGDALMEQGFDVVKVAGADRTDYKSTQILVAGDKKGTATIVARALNLGSQAVISQSAPTPSAGAPDIRVILGQDVQ